IHMPSNTWAGIVLAGLSGVLGFALIWHMWPLAVLAFAALIGVTIAHTFNYQRDHYVPAEEVVRCEAARTALLSRPVRAHRHHPAPARAGSGTPVLRPGRAPPEERHPAGLLGLPDERLPGVRVPVRHLRRGGPQLRRRADRRGPVRPAAGGGQYLAAAAVVHHLRLRHAGDAPAAPGRHPGLAGRHRAAGRRLPGPGAVRVRPPDPPGRRPAAQRLPVCVLHPGRHAWPARHLRHRLAGDADGAGRPARPDPREPAPPDVPVDVLALPGPDLGRRVHLRLPDGSPAMSERSEHTPNLSPPHGAGHHHEDDDGPHGTLASYLTGFVLAAILTAIPFWLVMDGVFASSRTTALVILAFAVVQIV